MDPRQILKLPMEPNDADAETVGDYLATLLATVWIEGEGFSGKRPFGNSGWHYEIYSTLAKAGLVDGSFDEYGYVETMDDDAADEIILKAIRVMSKPW